MKTIGLTFTLLATVFLALGQIPASEIQKIQNRYELMGGHLVLFDQDKINQVSFFGMADYHRNIPVVAQTKFRIASISKTITAIAIMQLVEKGKFSLDDDIGRLLGFKVENPKYVGKPMTVRMLMTHTSSLLDAPVYDAFLNETYNPDTVPLLKEILSAGGKFYSDSTFANHIPGTFFTYCNLNWGTLGTIVEKVSGERFDRYCQAHIFKPLGIDASYNLAELTGFEYLGVIYRKENGNWVAQTDNLEGKRPVYKVLEKYIPGTNAVRFGPQGGLRISGSDLAKIYMMFLNHGKLDNQRILKSKTVKQMFSPNWTYDGKNGDNDNGLMLCWGLGIHLITNTEGKDLVFSGKHKIGGHTGDAYGLISCAFIDYKTKKGFVFMTNGSGKPYVTGANTGFYAVEKEIFELIEKYY